MANLSRLKSLTETVRARVASRPILRQIVGNTGWLVVERLLRLLVGVVVGAWVARYLGPEQFGLFNFGIALVALFGFLADLGLDNIVIRELVREPDHRAEILGTTFVLKLLGSLLAAGLVIGLIFWLRPGSSLAIWLVAVLGLGTLFQAADAVDLWFQSQVLSKYAVAARNTAFLAMSAVRVVCILLHAPLMAFAIALLAESALIAIAQLLIYQRREGALNHWRLSRRRAAGMLRLCWPLLLASAAVAVNMKVDQVMVGSLLNDYQVGIYASAVRVSELWFFVPLAVSSSVYPTLIKLYHESEPLFYHKLKQVMGYLFWGTLLVSVTIAVFSRQIIGVLYGPAFAPAAPVLALHVFSGIVSSMGVVFGQKFVLDGSTHVNLYGAVVGAFANIGLNFWLIPLLGVYGAAVATVISYMVPMLFQTIFFDRRIGLTFLQSIFEVFRFARPEGTRLN